MALAYHRGSFCTFTPARQIVYSPPHTLPSHLPSSACGCLQLAVGLSPCSLVAARPRRAHPLLASCLLPLAVSRCPLSLSLCFRSRKRSACQSAKRTCAHSSKLLRIRPRSHTPGPLKGPGGQPITPPERVICHHQPPPPLFTSVAL